MSRKWSIPLLAALLVACNNSPSQDPPDETRVPTNIDSFDAFPNPINIGTQFTWTVFGTNLRCTIDVDSNGTIDYTVDNCTSSSRVNHTYPTNGQYIATLYLSGADGLTDQEKAIVKVLEANRSPNIIQLRHQPVASNPLSLAFGWSVDDADQHITQCQLDADSNGQIDFNDLCSKMGYTYTYPKPGKYTAMLRACDPYSCVERKLPVRVPYNTPPVINSLKGVAGSSLVGEVSFVVSDADNDSLVCKLQVSTIGTFTFNNCAEALRKYRFAEEGSYPVTLKVSDGLAEVSKSVVIKFGGDTPPDVPEPPLPPLPVCDYGPNAPFAPAQTEKQPHDVNAVGWFSNTRVIALIGYLSDFTARVTDYSYYYYNASNINKNSSVDSSDLVKDNSNTNPIPSSLALSPAASINDSSTHMAIGSVDGAISLFYFSDPDLMRELDTYNDDTRPGKALFPERYRVIVGWSALGLLVGGTGDPSSTALKVWDVSDIGNYDTHGVATEIPADYFDNPVTTLPHAGGINAIALSRSGTRLATGGGSNTETIKIWRLTRTGATLVRTLAQADDVLALAWSPDGTLLAAADSNNTVKIWNVASGVQVGSITHLGVRSVTFSPNGEVLVSGGVAEITKVWKNNGSGWTQLGGDLAPAPASSAASTHIDTLAFSPDGTKLAVGEGTGDERMSIFNFSCTGP